MTIMLYTYVLHVTASHRLASCVTCSSRVSAGYQKVLCSWTVPSSLDDQPLWSLMAMSVRSPAPLSSSSTPAGGDVG